MFCIVLTTVPKTQHALYISNNQAVQVILHQSKDKLVHLQCAPSNLLPETAEACLVTTMAEHLHITNFMQLKFCSGVSALGRG